MRISDWSSDVCSSDLLATGGRRGRDEVERAREERHGLRQVENVDAVARAEDIRLHARIPTVGLVTEVGASFDKILHRDDRCRHSLSPSGWSSGKQEPKARKRTIRHRFMCAFHVEWAGR